MRISEEESAESFSCSWVCAIGLIFFSKSLFSLLFFVLFADKKNVFITSYIKHQSHVKQRIGMRDLATTADDVTRIS